MLQLVSSHSCSTKHRGPGVPAGICTTRVPPRWGTCDSSVPVVICGSSRCVPPSTSKLAHALAHVYPHFTWGGRWRRCLRSSPRSVRDGVLLGTCLSSLPLSAPTHTRARGSAPECFMKEDLHDHSPVTSSPGRLRAAQSSNFPAVPPRRNGNETSVLVGLVSAGAILFGRTEPVRTPWNRRRSTFAPMDSLCLAATMQITLSSSQ